MAQSPSSRALHLFSEEFDWNGGVTDLDETVAEDPTLAYGEAELAAARDEAYGEGLRAGLAEAARDRAEITGRMLQLIAERMTEAAREAERCVEASAEAIAHLLLAALRAMLPALCARHGAAEILAMARAIAPALAREPKVVFRVSPHVAPELEAELARLAAEFDGRFELAASERIAPGDARIVWQDGAAVRDREALWREIEHVLAPLGLWVEGGASTPADRIGLDA